MADVTPLSQGSEEGLPDQDVSSPSTGDKKAHNLLDLQLNMPCSRQSLLSTPSPTARIHAKSPGAVAAPAPVAVPLAVWPAVRQSPVCSKPHLWHAYFSGAACHD